MTKNYKLLLGYKFDKWYGYGIKEPIYTDISRDTNSHILICGMSGSGKSYQINLLLAKLYILSNNQGKIYFADFKQDDSFMHLRGLPNYFPYEESLHALDIVYEILHKRQSGEDKERTPITFIWDEYIANILAIHSVNKKSCETVMRKVSEILMLGRSLAVRIVVSCQRPDAIAFPTGSRLNYGIILIVGAPIKSIYEMLIPKEYIDSIGDREFGVGEGIVLQQASQMNFIKIPVVNDFNKMKKLGIEALM